MERTGVAGLEPSYTVHLVTVHLVRRSAAIDQGGSQRARNRRLKRTIFENFGRFDQSCHGPADTYLCQGAANLTNPYKSAAKTHSGKNAKMLVLSRKVGEKLVIGDNVTVEIVRIQGNRITVGITAPSDVKILRGELQKHPVEPAKIEMIVEDGVLQAAC
jgi:carbon storage regulator CsrA